MSHNLFRAEAAVGDAMCDLENARKAELSDADRVREYLDLACSPSIADISADCGVKQADVRRILKALTAK